MNTVAKSLVWIMRTLRHPMISDVGILTVSRYIATGLGFLATVIVARILGPGDYGIVSLVMAYPILIWSFIGVKSVSVTTRYISSFRANGRNEEIKSICKLGYGLDFFVSLVALILVSATAWWVARYILHMPRMAWIMIVFATSLSLLSLTGTSWAVLSSLGMWYWLATFQILDKIITFTIVFGFLLSGFGVQGVVIGTALGYIILGLSMVVVTTYILYRNGFGLWWNASLSKILSLRKELSTFFGWNYLIVSLNGLMGQVPLMLLGRLRGPEEAGFYRLAASLTIVGSYLETSLGKIIYPVLSVHWTTRDKESIRRNLKRWTLQAGLSIGAFLLLTVPFLPFIISVIFGSGYSPMVLGTQVMMLGAVVSSVFFWLTQFYYASGRIYLWTKGYALYTTIVMGLGGLCIQRWGFLGLAILITVAKIVFTLSMALGFPESPLRNSGQE